MKVQIIANAPTSYQFNSLKEEAMKVGNVTAAVIERRKGMM
jgi:hypothetical protein